MRPPSLDEIVITPVVLTFNDSSKALHTSSVPFCDSYATSRSSTYTRTMDGLPDGLVTPAMMVCSLGHFSKPALSFKILEHVFNHAFDAILNPFIARYRSKHTG